MNEISIIGNYIAITLHGNTHPFFYSKKNTIINVTNDAILMNEITDGKLTIQKNDVDSSLWSNSEIGIFTWSSLIEFLLDNTANFSPAPGGSGAEIIVNYSNVLFVDPVHGNDATAIVGRFDKPFQTINGATTLASAIGGSISQRILIWIRKGLYNSNVNLIAWTDVYCEPGVVFNSGTIRDNGLSVVSNFFGFAKFVGKTGTTLNITGSSNVHFEFDTINQSNSSVMTLLPPIGGQCNVVFTGNSVDTTTSGVGFGVTIRRKSNVIMNVKNHFRASHSVIDVRDNYDGISVINCPKIILGSQNIFGGNFKQCVISYSSTASSKIVVNGDLINEMPSFLGGIAGMITNWSSCNGTIELNGNIYSGQTYGIYASGNVVPGKVIVNGSIFSKIQPIFVSSNNSCFVKNGVIVKDDPISGSVIAMNQNGKLFISNCSVYNAQIDGDVIFVINTTNELNCINVTIQSEGNLGFGIVSANLVNVKTHGCRSNKALSPNVTDQLVPSGYIFDPLFVAPKF